MRTVFFIIQKEFLQVFRNKTMLPLIFIMPIVQLIILVNAATLEMKKIDMLVVDNDLSTSSRKLISKFDGSPFFIVQNQKLSVKQGEAALKDNSAEVVLVIPNNFERNLIRENNNQIQFLINAIDGTAAGLINAYASQIVTDFNMNLIIEWLNIDKKEIELPILTKARYWYNENLNYKIYMLPGILVILVTVIGMFLSSFNIVREKEMGTIEQINVTPIKKYQFIIGKLLPFLIIALVELAIGLTIGKIFFQQPIEGSLVVLFTIAFIYLLVCLGLGLFFSAISNTQQQVMFTLYFFILVFILMSGIFTPIDSMPLWAQWVNIANPFVYFMRSIRMVMLKGAGFTDIYNELISLGIYAVIILNLAVWRYKKIA